MHRPNVEAPSTSITEQSSLHDLLLQRAQQQPSPLPGQVLLGRLVTLPDNGLPGMAEVADLGKFPFLHSLVQLDQRHLGHTVALSMLLPQQSLVLGLVWNGREQHTPADFQSVESAALTITADGHREVIEAAQELELRCGEACIVLTADGRIQLRGTYITSHASATQRIIGGSVHVN